MSTKAVIVWLVLAVILGAIVILILLMPEKAPPLGTVAVGSRLLSFKPGEVEQIAVATPGQPRQVVERAPGAKSILGADAEWQLRIEPAKPGNAALPAWPLESAKLHSLLRVLSEMRATALPASGMELGAATTVDIQLSGSRTVKLTLAERTLAGTGLIEIDAAPEPKARALVPDQIHAVFTNPGPREWREPFPLAGIAPDASRIRIEGKGKPLALAKLEGKWSLREPVQAPADRVAVERLLAALGRISIADFLDQDATASATGLEKPTGTITIEADRRTVPPGSAEAVVTTDIVTLAMGNAADAGVSRLFCSVSGKRVVLINSAGIREIGSDPGAVLWPHPLRELPSDIGSVAITLSNPIAATTAEKSFKRAEGRWVQSIAGNTDVPLAAKEQRDVDALLVCLTGAAPASTQPDAPAIPRPVASVEAPAGYRVIGSVAVGSLAGRAIDSLELATADKDLIVIRTGPVYRGYAADHLPGLLRDAVQSSTPVTPPPRVVP